MKLLHGVAVTCAWFLAHGWILPQPIPRLAPLSATSTPSQRTQLRWIVQAVEKMNHTQDAILASLSSLAAALTQQQVVEAGRRLEIASKGLLAQPLTDDTQGLVERLTKAAALTGLHRLTLRLLEHLLDHDRIPDAMVQDAVFRSLRKAGRLEPAKGIMERLTPVSLSAFNIYLAFLADIVTEKDTTPKRTHQSRAEILAEAAAWLSRPNMKTDAISYATVLQAAATVGNTTMVDQLWKEMKDAGLRPNTVAYNARLRASRNSRAVYTVWEEMSKDKDIQPDRYTIDLLLLPLLRANRRKELKSLLRKFVASHSEKTAADAFGAFLLTLSRAGETTLARQLFDGFLLPSLAPVVSANAGAMSLIRPTTRHFNIVLEGYRTRVEDETPKAYLNVTTDHSSIVAEAWELYQTMVSLPGVCPDSYTMTTMMGLCRDSTELCRLVQQATDELELELSSVMVRAAITAFGKLGDPSSACWMFAKFVGSPMNDRAWNVLLGAVAHGAGSLTRCAIDMEATELCSIFADNHFAITTSPIYELFHGRSCEEAMKRVLTCLFDNNQQPEVRLPRPSSQALCLIASALQHAPPGPEYTMEIFRNATNAGVPADGRFVNAILRCFGDDIKAALLAWKNELRPASLHYETRPRDAPLPVSRSLGKNLVAGYNGLLYVSGRALRPEIALRIVYAMKKEDLEPSETSLNCYHSGKKARQRLGVDSGNPFLQRLRLIDAYESLLYVECTKYDQNDRRRAGEKRVRIIV